MVENMLKPVPRRQITVESQKNNIRGTKSKNLTLLEDIAFCNRGSKTTLNVRKRYIHYIPFQLNSLPL